MYKIAVASLLQILILTSIAGCGRSSSERTVITLNPGGPQKPNPNPIGKPTVSADESLVQAELLLNSLRFSRNIISHFLKVDKADFEPTGCLQPDANIPYVKINWSQCKVGEKNLANGTSNATRVMNNPDPIKILTSLVIAPKDPNSGSTVEAKYEINDLVTIADQDNQKKVIMANMSYSLVRKQNNNGTKPEEGTNIYSMILNQVGFVMDPRTNVINRIYVDKGEATFFSKGKPGFSVKYITPDLFDIVGENKFLQSKFEIRLMELNEKSNSFTIETTDREIKEQTGKKSDWSCKTPGACLPIPGL